MAFFSMIIATAIMRVNGTSTENYTERGESRASKQGNLNRAHEFVANNVEHYTGPISRRNAPTRFMQNHPNGLLAKRYKATHGGTLQRVPPNQSPQGGSLTGAQGWIKAQLTIDVTRNSYNIPLPLPVELFNSIDLFTGSKQVAQYLGNPDLQLLSANEDATLTNWVYTFRQISTGFTDTVTISCQEVSYVKLVYGLLTDMIVVGGGTVTVSDTTQALDQFSQQIVFTEQNIFGKQNNNPVNMGSFVKPDDFRPEIVRILTSFSVDKQRGFIQTCLYVPNTSGGYALNTRWFLSMSAFSIHSHTHGHRH